MENELSVGDTFWPTLAFADVSEGISCLSVLQALRLVPPEEKEKEECENKIKSPLCQLSFSQTSLWKG